MKIKFTLLVFLFGSTILFGPGNSYADWGRHGVHPYYHYHNHPRYGFRVHAFYPDEYFPVWVGGSRYYYDDGVYYNYVGGSYVVVSPPVGAVVSTVPSDFQPVVINGITYYADNGIYYVHTASGYQVVSQPTVAASAQNTFTINVPRYRGGYVAVVLRRSGNG